MDRDDAFGHEHGEMILLSEAEKVLALVVSTARTKFLMLPWKLAPAIQSCETALEIEACLRQGIEAVLAELAREGDTAFKDLASKEEDS